MEFIRIDENTVRCIVNEDDMREYDVKIDDFIKNGSKVQEFLHTVVEKATDEIGYEPKDGMLAMQIMMLPKNRLAITFSEKVDRENDFGELIKQVAGATIEKVSSFEELFAEDAPNPLGEKENKEKKKQKKAQSFIQIFEFKELSDFEEFAALFTDKLFAKSSMYKDDMKNIYYVIFEKGRMSKVNFGSVCRMASEYGVFLSDAQERKEYIEEHFKCLIKSKAMKEVNKMMKAGF